MEQFYYRPEQDLLESEAKAVIEEKEYTPFLTKEEKEYLARHQHCLDYPLSDEQLQFLDEHGYLILRKIVSKELCEKIVREGMERAKDLFGLNENDEQSWKKLPFHGCADIWQLKSLYTLREHPLLYSVFAQLVKSHKLTPSIDRINIKSPSKNPEESKKQNANLSLHTDLNYWHYDPNFPQYQGGLCLRDCPEGGGGFFCIPGFHKRRRFEKYMKNVESGVYGPSVRVPGPNSSFVEFHDEEFKKKKVEVALEQGDFVIWNGHLPHNGGFNSLKNHWRWHAFVRFMPLDKGPQQEWHREYQALCNSSRKTGVKPSHYSTGNTVKSSNPNREVPYHRNIRLSWLGMRLFGEKEYEN